MTDVTISAHGPVPSPGRTKRPGTSRRARDTRTFWLFVLPTLIVLLGVGLYPVLASFFLSLHREVGQRSGEFVGLDNYVAIATDPRFWNSLWVSLRFWILAVGLQLVLGLGLALAIRRTGWETRLVTVFMLPMLMAPVVVAVVWLMLYHPTVGLLNSILRPVLGTPAWLTDINLALPALVIVDTWQWMPFMFLVLRAGVLSAAVEPQEAAVVDGASRFQLFRHVLLPQLYPAIAVVLLIRSIDVLKVFDVIYVMTGGGPGRLTETLGIYIYRTAFEEFNLGYAAALSYTQLLLVLVLGLGFVIRVQRRQEEGA